MKPRTLRCRPCRPGGGTRAIFALCQLLLAATLFPSKEAWATPENYCYVLRGKTLAGCGGPRRTVDGLVQYRFCSNRSHNFQYELAARDEHLVISHPDFWAHLQGVHGRWDSVTSAEIIRGECPSPKSISGSLCGELVSYDASLSCACPSGQHQWANMNCYPCGEGQMLDPGGQAPNDCRPVCEPNDATCNNCVANGGGVACKCDQMPTLAEKQACFCANGIGGEACNNIGGGNPGGGGGSGNPGSGDGSGSGNPGSGDGSGSGNPGNPGGGNPGTGGGGNPGGGDPGTGGGGSPGGGDNGSGNPGGGGGNNDDDDPPAPDNYFPPRDRKPRRPREPRCPGAKECPARCPKGFINDPADPRQCKKVEEPCPRGSYPHPVRKKECIPFTPQRCDNRYSYYGPYYKFSLLKKDYIIEDKCVCPRLFPMPYQYTPFDILWNKDVIAASANGINHKGMSCSLPLPVVGLVGGGIAVAVAPFIPALATATVALPVAMIALPLIPVAITTTSVLLPTLYDWAEANRLPAENPECPAGTYPWPDNTCRKCPTDKPYRWDGECHECSKDHYDNGQCNSCSLNPTAEEVIGSHSKVVWPLARITPPAERATMRLTQFKRGLRYSPSSSRLVSLPRSVRAINAGTESVKLFDATTSIGVGKTFTHAMALPESLMEYPNFFGTKGDNGTFSGTQRKFGSKDPLTGAPVPNREENGGQAKAMCEAASIAAWANGARVDDIRRRFILLGQSSAAQCKYCLAYLPAMATVEYDINGRITKVEGPMYVLMTDKMEHILSLNILRFSVLTKSIPLALMGIAMDRGNSSESGNHVGNACGNALRKITGQREVSLLPLKPLYLDPLHPVTKSDEFNKKRAHLEAFLTEKFCQGKPRSLVVSLSRVASEYGSMKRIEDDHFTILSSRYFKIRDAVDVIEPLDPLKRDTGYAVVDFDCNNELTLSDSTEWGKRERWNLDTFVKEMEYVMAQPLTYRAPEVSGGRSESAKRPLERIGDSEVPLKYGGQVDYDEAKQRLTKGNASLARFFDAVPEAMFLVVSFDKQNKTAAIGVSTAANGLDEGLGSVNGVTFATLPRNGAHRHLAQLLLPRNININDERSVDTDKYKLRGAGLFKDHNGSWFITRGPSRAVTATFKRREGETLSNYITEEEAEILRSILFDTVGINATIMKGTKDKESE